VREAESALGVAEAAYRFGERGILDYLDAQRVLPRARSGIDQRAVRTADRRDPD
jgi:outer membrane protein TolC